MRYERTTPCATCPYREDVAPGIWHASEYEKLLRADADPMRGAAFLCHLSSARPMEDAEYCIGWLIDQKRRGVPNIPLRWTLMTRAEAADQFNRARRPNGVALYESIKEMCAANVGTEFPEDDVKAIGLKRMLKRKKR